MGEAAKISLKAIGMQDTHLLSKDPDASLFNPAYKQHSEFRKYHRTRTIDNLQRSEWWPFGHTVKVEFNPRTMGDLLTNLWVKIELPEWTTSEKSDWFYGDFVGRRLIKNIKMSNSDKDKVYGVVAQALNEIKEKLDSYRSGASKFRDNTFDFYTISYGIRNVNDINLCLKEAYRVLKVGGRFMCLEFSKVENEILESIYNQYSKLIPPIGKYIVGSSAPYEYLIKSIELFYSQDELKKLIEVSWFISKSLNRKPQSRVARAIKS